jgi:hypothetical protein
MEMASVQKKQRLHARPTIGIYLPPPVLQLVLQYVLDGRTETEKMQQSAVHMVENNDYVLTTTDEGYLRTAYSRSRLIRLLRPVRMLHRQSDYDDHPELRPWVRAAALVTSLCRINRRTVSHAFIGMCKCNLEHVKRFETQNIKTATYESLLQKRFVLQEWCYRCRCTADNTTIKWPVSLPAVEVMIFHISYFRAVPGFNGDDSDTRDIALRLVAKRKLQWLVIVG